jgi:predicted metalloprotease with PDZ domain
VRSDSPAAEAGLQVGDTIKTFDGIRLTPGNFLSTIGRYRPGNRVEVIIHRGQRSMQMMLTLGEPQILNYRIEEMKDAPVETKALRAAWLLGVR